MQKKAVRQTTAEHGPAERWLVVEEAHAGEGHDHGAAVALVDDRVVADGAARLGDVLDAGLGGARRFAAQGKNYIFVISRMDSCEGKSRVL